MSITNNNVEIAGLEWRRVTGIAWPTISAIFAIQALFSENPIRTWQILYIFGLIIVTLISWTLARNSRITFSSTPTVIYLLISPLIIGNLSQSSWMSIGLAAFAAVIYYSTIENLYIAFATIISITAFQTFIASKNLSSISDNLDISYFYSYFSILWIFIMGISSVFIRRRYLKVAESVQDTVDSEINSVLTRLKTLKQINEKDSRNLRLHGTVLNTLIHLRNLIADGKPTFDPSLTLIKEIESLSTEKNYHDSRSLRLKVESLISNRTLNRINISLSIFEGEVNSPLVEESCIEVIRELILNCEKHTPASSATITVSRNIGKSIRINFTDDSISSFDGKNSFDELHGASQSKTLQSLLSACAGTMEVTALRNGELRSIEIEIPYINLKKELKTALAHSRIVGLNDFSLNYVKASTLVTLLSIPGYFLVGLNFITLLLTVFTALMLLLVFRYPSSSILLATLICISLLIIPSISRNIESCSDLNPIPWLFNHILTVGFYGAIYIKNRFFKWVPIVILSAECLYFPLFFPDQCKNIFLGSLPGIPLIAILALAVLGIRRREIKYDENESLELARLSTVFSSADDYREVAYTVLLKDCSEFAALIANRPNSLNDIELITLQIQKIQSYLVCSEHFNSELIRKTYELFREKQSEKILGRLILLGDNFIEFEQTSSVEAIVEQLRAIKGFGTSSLTIINAVTLEFHFEGGEVAQKPSALNGIPVFYDGVVE